jgi:hypothetical protein
LYGFLISPMRATCPTHPILLYVFTLIFLEAYKLWRSHYAASPASRHVFQRRSKYSPRHGRYLKQF